MTTSMSFFARVAVLAVGALAFASVGCAGDEQEPAAESGEDAIITNMPSEPPSEESWARGMIARACDLPSSALKGSVGSIERNERDKSVTYVAKKGQEVLASAWAANETIFVSKSRGTLKCNK